MLARFEVDDNQNEANPSISKGDSELFQRAGASERAVSTWRSKKRLIAIETIAPQHVARVAKNQRLHEKPRSATPRY
jgi:hypothetical protein